MSRSAGLIWRILLGGLALALLLTLLTPLGPWAGTRLLRRLAAAQGWRIEVADHAGSLLGGFSLNGLVAASQATGIRIAVEQVKISPWSYTVKIARPDLRLRIAPTPAEKPAAKSADETLLRLPIEHLPDIEVSQGHIVIEWPEAAQALEVNDLRILYRAVDDTSGRLTAFLPQVALSEKEQVALRGEVKLEGRLSPTMVEVDSLGVAVEMDTIRVEGEASGKLTLLPGLPLTAQLTARLQTRSKALRAELKASGEGGLEPSDLQIELRGSIEHPQLQRMDLSAWVKSGEKKVTLDSLWLGLLGGELVARGDYYPHADSLEVRARIGGVDLTLLPKDLASGVASGWLDATLNLEKRGYDVDLGLQLRGLELLPGKPLDLELEASHRFDRSTRVELTSPLLTLTASGTVDPIALIDSAHFAESYDLKLDGVLKPEPLVNLKAAPVRVTGRARPDLLELQLRTPRLPGTFGEKFGELTLELNLVENRYLEAALALEEDLLALRLGMDISKGEVDSLVSFLAPLGLQRLVPGLQGNLRGQMRAHGKLETGDLHLSSRFDLPGAAYGDWRTGPLTLRLAFEDQRATCLLKGSGLQIEAVLDTAKQLSGRAAFDGTLLYRKEGEEAVVLSGELDWRARIDQLEAGEVSLDLERLQLRQDGWEVSSRQPLRMKYTAGDLRVEQLDLQTPLGPLSIAGSVVDDTLSMIVRMPDLDLRQVLPELTLKGSGQAELTGTLQEPRVKGRVDLQKVLMDTLELGDVEVRLGMADSLTLEVLLLQEERDEPAVEVLLKMPAGPLLRGFADTTDGNARLKFAARKVDLKAPLTFALQRAVRGWLQLEGELSVPMARLDSSTSWQDLQGKIAFQGLQLRTEVEGDSLRLDLVPGGGLLLDGDRLQLRDLQLQLQRYDRDAGRFLPAGGLRLGGDLRGGSDTHLSLALEKVDLITFNGPEGMASLQALVAGTLQQPDIKVDLAIDTEDLGKMRGKLEGDASGAEFRINWTTPLEDSLEVRGALPWNWERGKIDAEQGWLHARTEGFGLSTFAEQFPELDHLDGVIAIDLRVEGLGENVSLEGYADVEDLEFALLDVKPVYIFPQGRLEFSGTRGEFRNFVSPARKENGRMELSGYIDMARSDEPQFSVNLQTEGLVFRYEDIFRAPDIDMTISLEGSNSSSRLVGNVRLNEPVAEAVLVTFNAPPVPPPPPTLRDEFMENMAMELFVDIRDLQVDSELAQVRISGGIDVGGTFYKPIFQGDMEIDAGKVFILNRQFDFEKGRIVLNSLVPTRSILDVAYDPLLLDPELDMTASCSLVDHQDDIDYTVTLNVQGTAQAPAPEFLSTPAKDFNSIVRLLAFGSVSSQLEYTTALGTAAGQLLSKQVEKVGLDEFTVLPSSAVIGSDPGDPAILMGKYFGAIPFPMWVRYEATVNEMSSGEVRLEHKLKSYLTITGAAQSKYDRYGLGIGLKKDF